MTSYISITKSFTEIKIRKSTIYTSHITLFGKLSDDSLDMSTGRRET